MIYEVFDNTEERRGEVNQLVCEYELLLSKLVYKNM